MHVPVSLPGPRRLAAVRAFLTELGKTVLVVGVVYGGVHGVLENFQVEGPSMNPTLSTGEFVWVDKAAYAQLEHHFVLGGPHRGDIAVLRSPDGPDDVDLIKWVIGLPGDRLLVQHGRVFVDGQPLEEPYVRFPASYTYPADGQPVRVPDHQFFVLGDNRANSRDSHMGWFVSADRLVGRA